MWEIVYWSSQSFPLVFNTMLPIKHSVFRSFTTTLDTWEDWTPIQDLLHLWGLYRHTETKILEPSMNLHKTNISWGFGPYCAVLQKLIWLTNRNTGKLIWIVNAFSQNLMEFKYPPNWWGSALRLSMKDLSRLYDVQLRRMPGRSRFTRIEMAYSLSINYIRSAWTTMLRRPSMVKRDCQEISMGDKFLALNWVNTSTSPAIALTKSFALLVTSLLPGDEQSHFNSSNPPSLILIKFLILEIEFLTIEVLLAIWKVGNYNSLQL